MTTFTQTQRTQLIEHLAIPPDRLAEFDLALKTIEEKSALSGVDYVSQVTTKLDALVAISAPPVTVDVNDPLAPVLNLQNKGVKSFQTEELTVTFTGSTFFDSADNLRNWILSFLQAIGYNFWGGHARVFRS